MLIGRVRVFVDNLRWLSTLLINTLLPELFFVDNLRWLSTLLINTLLPELLQLNAEFNLYSWIFDKVCHNCLEIELSLFF